MSNFYQSITFWAFTLLASVQVNAQSEPQILPLTLTGFNADVVAEGIGGNANEKTTHSVDAFYVFYSKDFVPSIPHSSSASALTYGGGLENNGTLLSTAVTGLTFQMANYASNNALLLRNNVTNQGTLALDTPKKAEKLYIAAVRGEGGSGAADNHDVTVTVNFADGTWQDIVFQATAWWQDGAAPANTAIAGTGEISRNSATSGWAPRNEFRGSTQASLFYNELNLDAANYDKEITSISFNKATTANAAHTTAILAVSIYTTEPVVTQPAITGFTYDIIANGIGNASDSSDLGMDEQNQRALVSLDFQATAQSTVPTRGLPIDGFINSVATPGITYRLADYTGANALYLTPTYVTGSVNDQNSGTLSFTAQNRDKIYILSTATGGGATGLTYNAVVNFNDGTTQAATLQARDWYGGSPYAIQGIGRVNRANNNLEEQSNVANPRLYEDVITLTAENQSKTITGITFNFEGDASAEWGNEIRLAILAVETTVAQPIVAITAVALTTQNNVPATITTNEGSLQLVAAVNPGNASQAVTWSIIAGNDFASLSNSGLLAATANGTVTVRATSVADNTKFDQIEITITGQVQGYCEAYFINGCENLNISNVVTTGAQQNISNATTGCIGTTDTTNGYSNYTSVVLKAYRNTPVTFTVNFTGSLTNFTYLSAWVDWNHDYTFSDDESVYVSTTEEVSGALQFTTTAPANAVIGQTRIRLKAVSGWIGSGSCGYNSQGEVEDYTFEILSDEPTYCTPTYTGWAVNEPAEPITSVQFGVDENVANAINQTSASEVSIETPRYEDFSAVAVDVTKGNTYTLRVKANTNGNNTNYITIYFDWNGDGTFSNRTPENAEQQQQLINQPEKHQHTTAIINSNGLDTAEMVHTVTIPNDAATGRTRMRIVKNYNAPSNGPCSNPFFPRGQVEDYTLNIQNGIEIEEVTVTTANSVEAVITTQGGTLQLVATVAPTATASQNVTWTVTSGSDFATVNTGGLVTAVSNGTAVVRATSVQDTTKFDEIEITVAVAGPCDAVEAFRYEFDDFTAFPEQCWASSQGYPMIGLTTDADKAIRLYSFTNPTADFYIVSPAVSTINGEYVLEFDIESVAANAAGGTLQVGTLAAQNDYSTFAPVGSPIVLSAATAYTSLPVPAVQGHQYAAIKYTPTGVHQIVTIDNIEWKLAEELGTGNFNTSGIKVYPNPSKDIVNIDTALQIESVNVFSLVGQKVFSGTTNRVDLASYPAGVYMFQIITANNQTQVFKVIKQ